MKLAKYMVKVDLKADDKNYMLINTLFGSVQLIEERYSNIIDEWKSSDNIEPKSEDEKLLFDFLVKNKFIIDESKELKAKEDIFSKMREYHKKKLDNRSDMMFVLTYDCNFRCPYCYEGVEKTNKKIISKEMVDKVFEINKNLETIGFFGGEPLMLSNMEIIKYIISKKPNAYFYALTNGYYLEEFFDVFKKVNVSYIQVTIDGDEDIHNKTRILEDGGATFKKIMKGIDLYLQNNITIKIRMNITKTNMESCLKLKERLINKYGNTQYLIFEMQPIFQLSKDDKDIVEEKVYWDKDTLTCPSDSKKEVDLRKNDILQTASPIIKTLVLGGKGVTPKYCHCDAEEYARFYDSEGDIYSCVIAVGKPKYSAGKYYPEYKLKENSYFYRNIETIKECNDCNLALFCGGGCANEINHNGDVLKPNCKKIHEDIYEAIPKIYKNFYLEKQHN